MTDPQTEHMSVEFVGEVWEWRGPAPYYFVSVPEDECAYLREVSPIVTYGWGMIPVRVQVGDTEWKTSLWPKDGGYVLPLKDLVRRSEGIEAGAEITVSLTPTGSA